MFPTHSENRHGIAIAFLERLELLHVTLVTAWVSLPHYGCNWGCGGGDERDCGERAVEMAAGCGAGSIGNRDVERSLCGRAFQRSGSNSIRGIETTWLRTPGHGTHKISDHSRLSARGIGSSPRIWRHRLFFGAMRRHQRRSAHCREFCRSWQGDLSHLSWRGNEYWRDRPAMRFNCEQAAVSDA